MAPLLPDIRRPIFERRDHRAWRAIQSDRPLILDQAAYPWRNVVERGINRLKQRRGLATCYE